MVNREKIVQKTVRMIVVLGLFVLLIVHSEPVQSGVRDALILCYRTVIPSLFPFLILSSLLTESGFPKICATCFAPVMKPLFSVGGAGAFPFIVGLLSGYPVGAKTIGSLYESGAISKGEAEKLLAFCNNAGPLFIIGAVGVGMLGSLKTGILLYVIHVISAILAGFFLRFIHSGDSVKGKSLTGKNNCQAMHLNGMAGAVSKSVETILQICGYIVLFSAIRQAVLPLVLRVFPDFILLLISGLFEVTGGVAETIKSGLLPRTTFSLLSFFLGVGGVCVYLQVSGVLKGTGIGTKTYCFGKVLQGVFAFGLSFVLYPLWQIEAKPVFADVGHILHQTAGVLPHLVNLFILFMTALLLPAKRRRKGYNFRFFT